MDMSDKLYPKRQDGRTTIHRGAYNSWRAMKQRCYYEKYWARKSYAGKGIKVCDRWLGRDGFVNFLSDMGDRPDEMSLDRIDNNKDYCPENCRWADQKTQVMNSSRVSNAYITAEDLSVAVCSTSTVYERIRKGWSKQDALNTPSQQHKVTRVYGPCPVCEKTWSKRQTKYCSRECYIKAISLKERDGKGRFS